MRVAPTDQPPPPRPEGPELQWLINGCCNYKANAAVSSTAGSFFRLRPSDSSAPERPLLKRRRAGGSGINAIFTTESGCAALPAPFSLGMIFSTIWRLHAATRHTEGWLRTARQPQLARDNLNQLVRFVPATVNYPLRRLSSIISPVQLQSAPSRFARR